MSQTEKQISKAKIAIIGGDARQLHLARYLAASAEVSVYGILPQESIWGLSDLSTPYSLATAIKDATAIILPIPFSRDGTTVNTPLWEEKIPLKEILSTIKNKDIKIFAGLCTPEFTKLAEESGCILFDYGLDENIAAAGALPTAEAALALAINETHGLISGSKVAILGSGRIAAKLSPLLRGVGANVTLCSRRDMGVAGGDYIPLDQLGKAIDRADVIFNTIPAPTLTPEILESIKGGLIIDLASPVQGQELPIGITRQQATEAGVRVIHALGLPGKCSPKYSGEMLGEYVLEHLGIKSNSEPGWQQEPYSSLFDQLDELLKGKTSHENLLRILRVILHSR